MTIEDEFQRGDFTHFLQRVANLPENQTLRGSFSNVQCHTKYELRLFDPETYLNAEIICGYIILRNREDVFLAVLAKLDLNSSSAFIFANVLLMRAVMADNKPYKEIAKRHIDALIRRFYDHRTQCFWYPAMQPSLFVKLIDACIEVYPYQSVLNSIRQTIEDSIARPGNPNRSYDCEQPEWFQQDNVREAYERLVRASKRKLSDVYLDYNIKRAKTEGVDEARREAALLFLPIYLQEVVHTHIIQYILLPYV